jgi:hypothetical protein
LVAWLLPGGGHILQGRRERGVLLGGAVCLMFACGLLFGGHLFALGGGGEDGSSKLLQLLPAIANVGMGLLYGVSWIFNAGFAEEAQRATFEYGNTFLLVAGLLNYLVMLDAFDIGTGRKG